MGGEGEGGLRARTVTSEWMMRGGWDVMRLSNVYRPTTCQHVPPFLCTPHRPTSSLNNTDASARCRRRRCWPKRPSRQVERLATLAKCKISARRPHALPSSQYQSSCFSADSLLRPHNACKSSTFSSIRCVPLPSPARAYRHAAQAADQAVCAPPPSTLRPTRYTTHVHVHTPVKAPHPRTHPPQSPFFLHTLATPLPTLWRSPPQPSGLEDEKGAAETATEILTSAPSRKEWPVGWQGLC
jgi:hypothetical protein